MKLAPKAVLFVAYLALVFGLCWLLRSRLRLPLARVATSLLQMVAIYTLLLGFFLQAGVLDALPTLRDELTSTDPAAFLAGNLTAFAVLSSALAIALDPSTSSSIPRFLLSTPVLLALVVVFFVYALVHFLVVVPVSYFGFLITSVPIDAILYSGAERVISINGGESLRIREIVDANEASLRRFAVALPAFVMFMIVKALSAVKGRAQRRTAEN